MSPYSPTAWVNNTTPNINAANLNKIEGGIQSAQAAAEAAQSSANSAVQSSRQVNTGNGLTGGGDLSVNRTHAVDFGTLSTQVASGNRGIPTGGTTAQSLVKNSNTDYDVGWVTVAGGGGGGATLQDEGTTLGTQRSVWNVVGEGIDASDDASNTRTQIRARGTVARAGTAPTSPQTNQLWVDTSAVSQGVPKQYDGATWQSLLQWTGITGTPTTFTPTAHASTHAAGGSDPVTIVRYDTLTFFASGTLNARTGVGHEIAIIAGTLDAFWINADTAPSGGTITATLIKEAGGPGGTATTIGTATLSAGGRGTVSTTGLSVSLAQGDCVRCDLSTGTGYTAASCANMTVKARYSY